MDPAVLQSQSCSVSCGDYTFPLRSGEPLNAQPPWWPGSRAATRLAAAPSAGATVAGWWGGRVQETLSQELRDCGKIWPSGEIWSQK